MVVVDATAGAVVRQLAVKGHVAPLAWHPVLNQLAAGAGGREFGGCHVFYDPVMSEKGALLCVGRRPR